VAAGGAAFRDRAESHDQCRQGGRTDDQGEMQRIVGKLQESGMGKEAQQYVLTEMTKPLGT
jgi:uncharacterized membrane protein YebE (DUF533 family)